MSSDSNSRLERIFPNYFRNFIMPEGAHPESIMVYRACRSGKCDRASFLTTFEQHGFKYMKDDDPSDPGVYSLSTFEKPNHIKRWADLTSDMNIPYKIAIGCTNPKYGIIQRTKERKGRKARSHVDWWLYENARPETEFELISDFEEYLRLYHEKGEGGGE